MPVSVDFTLDPTQLLTPDSKAIAEYIHLAKYARYKPEHHRRESHAESVSRVEEMHLRRFPTLTEEIKPAFKWVYDRKVVGSMRNFQFGGTAVEANHCRSYNCTFSYCNRWKFFSELLLWLLSGAGVGVSVQKHHVKQLTPIKRINPKNVVHHVIKDSIEGWADAVHALMLSFQRGYYVEFSYHKIRAEGELLKTSGGRAPGHLSLKNSLEKIRGILTQAQGRKLRPFECHRICCFIANAVLSGGIRRSSMIALFSVDDDEMATCKTGDWFNQYPELSNSNNSAVMLRSDIKKAQFKDVFASTRQWGEPGFFFTNNKEYGVNPCLKLDCPMLTPDGVKPFGSLKEGDTIWSGYRWTKILKKWCTGIKPVYRYVTDYGVLESTENHRVVSEGQKKEVGAVHRIDPSFVPVRFEGIINGIKVGDFIDPKRSLITEKSYIGEHEVWDLTVDAPEHTFWADGLLVSNCGEIGLVPYFEVNEETRPIIAEVFARRGISPKIKDGEVYTGFSVCNLSEVNCASVKTVEEFYAAVKAAAFIGTLQASYTDFDYMDWPSEVICKREALLGVSLTGILDNPAIALNREVQNKTAQIAIEENKRVAALIGIRPAARVTTVKPSGTTSLALGGIGSGHHPHHAKHYFRRVTANPNEAVFQYFKSINPQACEQKSNGDWVVTFPIKAPEGAITNADVSAIDFLESVRGTVLNWVRPGTARPESAPGCYHNVSNTVVVRDNEWEAVGDYIWEHRDDFTGLSLLSYSGDKDYAFAPREEVRTEADLVKWNNLVKNFKPVDYSLMVEEEDATNLQSEASCAGGACELTL